MLKSDYSTVWVAHYPNYEGLPEASTLQEGPMDIWLSWYSPLNIVGCLWKWAHPPRWPTKMADIPAPAFGCPNSPPTVPYSCPTSPHTLVLLLLLQLSYSPPTVVLLLLCSLDASSPTLHLLPLAPPIRLYSSLPVTSKLTSMFTQLCQFKCQHAQVQDVEPERNPLPACPAPSPTRHLVAALSTNKGPSLHSLHSSNLSRLLPTRQQYPSLEYQFTKGPGLSAHCTHSLPCAFAGTPSSNHVPSSSASQSVQWS